MILAILPFAILGATIPGDGPADKDVSEQKERSIEKLKFSPEIGCFGC